MLDGSDLNFKLTASGTSLLMLAAAKGFDTLAEIMLSKGGCDVNLKDRYGVNAYWVASFYGQLVVMKLLLSKGTNQFVSN